MLEEFVQPLPFRVRSPPLTDTLPSFAQPVPVRLRCPPFTASSVPSFVQPLLPLRTMEPPATSERMVDWLTKGPLLVPMFPKPRTSSGEAIVSVEPRVP
jgi:hypothetical protein